MDEPATTLSEKSIDRLKDWAAFRPLSAFFLLTLIISWVIWWVPYLLNLSDAVASRHLTAIGAFSPSLAALGLTWFTRSKPAHAKRWAGLEGFILAFLAAGAIYLICLPYASTLPLETTVAGWFVRILLISSAAWVMAAAFSSDSDLSRLWFAPSSRRSSVVWYIISLFGFPLLLLAGVGISHLTGNSMEVISPQRGPESLFLQVITLFFYILLLGGPLGSETGWRGFALPRLQSRFSPLIASIILGAAWALWRFPLFINGFHSSISGDWLPVFAEQGLDNLLLAFLFTWLFNHTRGNVLACVILHASVLTASAFIATTSVTTGLLVIAVVGCVLESRMWKTGPITVRVS